MDNKDLFKLLDSIQEDDENIPLKNEKRTLIIDGLNLFLTGVKFAACFAGRGVC